MTPILLESIFFKEPTQLAPFQLPRRGAGLMACPSLDHATRDDWAAHVYEPAEDTRAELMMEGVRWYRVRG